MGPNSFSLLSLQKVEIWPQTWMQTEHQMIIKTASPGQVEMPEKDLSCMVLRRNKILPTS